MKYSPGSGGDSFHIFNETSGVELGFGDASIDDSKCKSDWFLGKLGLTDQSYKSCPPNEPLLSTGNDVSGAGKLFNTNNRSILIQFF